MRGEARSRARIPFRAVNRPGASDYDPALQRHHLLPRALLARPSLARMLQFVDAGSLGFDDFRRNGLLLPARSDAGRRLGLPLHRGPHRQYSAMVTERVGQIEAGWARLRFRNPQAAGEEALFRLALLQRALRRRLLAPPGRPLRLNRHDPLGSGFDFSELDAMAESLWGATHSALADNSSFAA